MPFEVNGTDALVSGAGTRSSTNSILSARGEFADSHRAIRKLESGQCFERYGLKPGSLCRD
jgi:hypothetical protein